MAVSAGRSAQSELAPAERPGLRYHAVQHDHGPAAGSDIRTFDTQFNNLRRDPVKQLDLTMTKNFNFAERKYVQIRFEAFNATNRMTFGAPNTTATNSAFGMIASQANTPRRIETGLKLVW